MSLISIKDPEFREYGKQQFNQNNDMPEATERELFMRRLALNRIAEIAKMYDGCEHNPSLVNAMKRILDISSIAIYQLTPAEAKEKVLEKYPDAVESYYYNPNGGWVIRNGQYGKEISRIDDTAQLAWLSAMFQLPDITEME